MTLNIHQQITIPARAVTYNNGRETIRRAKRDFNISLQPWTVGMWRKRLLETGSIQKGKFPERPRSSTDAAITGTIAEMCAC